MSDVTNTFQRGLYNLLGEVFEGVPEGFGFMLNPGDAGLLGALDAIDAATASRHPPGSMASIAAHADHVLFGLELLNRWSDGEENPWAEADWDASWQRGAVTASEWDALRGRLREASKTWRGHVEARREWDDLAATGALASLAHTAYHMGAIRQIAGAVGAR